MPRERGDIDWNAPTPPPVTYALVVIGGHQVTLRNQIAICAYCGEPLPKRYHVDHIVPRVKGGGNEVENLIAACSACNISKNDADLDEYRKRRGCKDGGLTHALRSHRRATRDDDADDDWLEEVSNISATLCALVLKKAMPPGVVVDVYDVENRIEEVFGGWSGLVTEARDRTIRDFTVETIFPFERALHGGWESARRVLEDRIPPGGAE